MYQNNKHVNNYANNHVNNYANNHVNNYTNNHINNYTNNHVNNYANNHVNNYANKGVMNNMACGCTDKLNMNNMRLDNNIKLDDNMQSNNKTLSLDSMISMSTDDIINLYRQGYILEESKSLYSGLTYTTECTGTPVLDKSSTEENINDFIPLGIASAYAQKFTPASRCLSSITLKLRKVADVGATVRLCSDIGGYPDFPSSSLGEVTKYYSELSYTFTEVNFLFDIVLPNLSPIWIVVTSMYDPNSTDATELINIASTYIDTGGSLAGKYGNGAWISNIIGKPVFKTFKLNYSPAPILTSIIVAPTSTSVNIGSDSQLAATCKLNTDTVTCPTLTWSSSNPSKATVDSTGKVTGVSSGTTNITATYGSVTSNSSAITVSSSTPTVTSIVVTPASASVSIGGMTQLIATCKDQDVHTMTCPTPPTWSSSNPSRATVDSTGKVTGVSSGTTNITATYGSVVSNASEITIPAVSIALTSISPATVTLLPNATQQFTAKDQYSNAISTGVTWGIQSGAGSISTTGLYVAPPTAGTTVIYATYSGITKTRSITISTTPSAAGGGDSSMLIGIVGVAALGIMMTAKKP